MYRPDYIPPILNPRNSHEAHLRNKNVDVEKPFEEVAEIEDYEPPRKRSNLLLIIVIIVAFVILLAAAGFVFYYLQVVQPAIARRNQPASQSALGESCATKPCISTLT